MLSIITLELINSTSSSDRKYKFEKKNRSDEVEKEISKEEYERIENICILIPPFGTLLAIIIMLILYKIFM